MGNSWRIRRLVVVSVIGVGSLMTIAVSGLPSWSGVALVEAATTTSTSTTTTTTAPTTTKTASATTATKNYEVVAGIFLTKATAQAQIAALKKAKFNSFTIKNISPKFAVVRASLTKARATTLAKQINTHGHLGKARIKKLA